MCDIMTPCDFGNSRITGTHNHSARSALNMAEIAEKGRNGIKL